MFPGLQGVVEVVVQCIWSRDSSSLEYSQQGIHLVELASFLHHSFVVCCWWESLSQSALVLVQGRLVCVWGISPGTSVLVVVWVQWIARLSLVFLWMLHQTRMLAHGSLLVLSWWSWMGSLSCANHSHLHSQNPHCALTISLYRSSCQMYPLLADENTPLLLHSLVMTDPHRESAPGTRNSPCSTAPCTEMRLGMVLCEGLLLMGTSFLLEFGEIWGSFGEVWGNLPCFSHKLPYFDQKFTYQVSSISLRASKFQAYVHWTTCIPSVHLWSHLPVQGWWFLLFFLFNKNIFPGKFHENYVKYGKIT